MKSLAEFCRSTWSATLPMEAGGVRRPARIYDLRSTFASNALAAEVTVFELAEIMGTSVAMIERVLRNPDRGCRRLYRAAAGRVRGT